jgi:hypothetical protein
MKEGAFGIIGERNSVVVLRVLFKSEDRVNECETFRIAGFPCMYFRKIICIGFQG